jgi:hypothetical protein
MSQPARPLGCETAFWLADYADARTGRLASRGELRQLFFTLASQVFVPFAQKDARLEDARFAWAQIKA